LTALEVLLLYPNSLLHPALSAKGMVMWQLGAVLAAAAEKLDDLIDPGV
jgi:hypothetical protein